MFFNQAMTDDGSCSGASGIDRSKRKVGEISLPQPGGDNAPDLAPRPLDHFKRGYAERSETRERGLSGLRDRTDPRDRSRDYGRRRSDGGDHQRDHRVRYPPQYRCPRANRGEDQFSCGVDEGAPGGIDVNELIARLCASRSDINQELARAFDVNPGFFESGKALLVILSRLRQERNMRAAFAVWRWSHESSIVSVKLIHYNGMLSVFERCGDWRAALDLMEEMDRKGIEKDEHTYSAAITACAQSGEMQMALQLLDSMERNNVCSNYSYNAAITACEKCLKPAMAMEIFERMKKRGVAANVITYSALISACEKGHQWKQAFQVFQQMKEARIGPNVVAYSALISALSKGQQWVKAMQVFRELEESGERPSVVTYNALMSCLEKSLQWQRALNLFDEMKYNHMPVTVVSYGAAIMACEKGKQWQQCLDYLDEMKERRIKKNVIIFGAAMACMEKSCRADLSLQLMEQMVKEGVHPNAHIYNSAITACAKCDMSGKAFSLYKNMGLKVRPDVVTYNAILDAMCDQISLARKLFHEGVKLGFYAKVSRLEPAWLELDLHFLSLGAGETALIWWLEEALVPLLNDAKKFENIKSIGIVTGCGRHRTRGSRDKGDGMKKRIRAQLQFAGIKETEAPNPGRIHIDKHSLMEQAKGNEGRINFDSEGYQRFKAKETTEKVNEDVPQIRRLREGAARKAETFELPAEGDIPDVPGRRGGRYGSGPNPRGGRGQGRRGDLRRPPNNYQGSSSRTEPSARGDRRNDGRDNRHEPPHIQRWNDERQFSNSGPRRNYGERDGYNHEFDRRDGSRERFSEGGQSIKRFRGEEGHAEYNGYTAQRTRYR